MESLFLLIPLSLLLVGLAIWFFLRMSESGQFDDLEGPAHSILMDDDRPRKAAFEQAPGQASARETCEHPNSSAHPNASMDPDPSVAPEGSRPRPEDAAGPGASDAHNE